MLCGLQKSVEGGSWLHFADGHVAGYLLVKGSGHERSLQGHEVQCRSVVQPDTTLL